MFESLLRLLRDLSGRGDEVFVEALVNQVDATIAGVTFLLEAADPTKEVLEGIKQAEKAGDHWRRTLVEELAQSLTTPIGREDLFRVSRSIDDVLDNLRDFARELDLYGPRDRSIYVPLLQAVRDGMQELRGGVEQLTGDARDIRRASLDAKACANTIRRLYSEQIARLFAGDLDMDLLRHRELLRRLDVVGLRIGETADSLADGAMKRSR
jgi:uncharacterized protein